MQQPITPKNDKQEPPHGVHYTQRVSARRFHEAEVFLRALRREWNTVAHNPDLEREKAHDNVSYNDWRLPMNQRISIDPKQHPTERGYDGDQSLGRPRDVVAEPPRFEWNRDA
jgi:hypothetical protein